MQADFSPIWTFRANADEARLILRALGGRLQGEEEIAAAKALADDLARKRAQHALAYAHQMQQHADNIKE